jgi:hypothetical protein
MEIDMNTEGIEEILLRNEEDFAVFRDALASGNLTPEDGKKIESFFASWVEEARQEAANKPDPKTAFQEIVKAKFEEAMQELMQRMVKRAMAQRSTPVNLQMCGE